MAQLTPRLAIRERFLLIALTLLSCCCAVFGQIVTVTLDKQYVPVVRDNRTVAHKTAYFGTIYVGFPHQQNFTVVFDTGSGHFLLPSSSCQLEACLKHRRYERNKSLSAVDIDHDGNPEPDGTTERDQVAIAFGTGEVVGEFVRDVVCLKPFGDDSGEIPVQAVQPSDCVKARVITASEMTKDPFNVFEFDGVLGLGLESLALDPEFSFFGQMARLNKALPSASFGVFISRNDAVPSEISFGGIDERRTADPAALRWAPVVNPDLGYWQVSIKAVRVGNESLELCQDGGCVGILDTGTSLLGVPRQSAQSLHWHLARQVPDAPEQLDCRNWPGPEIIFDLEDGLKVVLGPEDYSRPAAMKVHNSKTNSSHVVCRSSLLPVDAGAALSDKAFILGEPVLRKYYTIYDWDAKRVGFALSKQSEAEDEEPDKPRRHHVFGAPHDVLPTATTVKL